MEEAVAGNTCWLTIILVFHDNQFGRYKFKFLTFLQIQKINVGRSKEMHPLGVQILSFLYSFRQKNLQNNMLAHPLWELAAPLRKIMFRSGRSGRLCHMFIMKNSNGFLKSVYIGISK